jgi:hypothetical protein
VFDDDSWKRWTPFLLPISAQYAFMIQIFDSLTSSVPVLCYGPDDKLYIQNAARRQLSVDSLRPCRQLNVRFYPVRQDPDPKSRKRSCLEQLMWVRASRACRRIFQCTIEGQLRGRVFVFRVWLDSNRSILFLRPRYWISKGYNWSRSAVTKQ